MPGTVLDSWTPQTFNLEVKHTFLQFADEPLSPQSRLPCRKTCPDFEFEDAVKSDCSDQSTGLSGVCGKDEPLKVELSSPWPEGAVTVKNSFINVSLDCSLDSSIDQETSAARAARRREVQSCPHVAAQGNVDDIGDDLSLSLSSQTMANPAADWCLLTPELDGQAQAWHGHSWSTQARRCEDETHGNYVSADGDTSQHHNGYISATSTVQASNTKKEIALLSDLIAADLSSQTANSFDLSAPSVGDHEPLTVLALRQGLLHASNGASQPCSDASVRASAVRAPAFSSAMMPPSAWPTQIFGLGSRSPSPDVHEGAQGSRFLRGAARSAVNGTEAKTPNNEDVATVVAAAPASAEVGRVTSSRKPRRGRGKRNSLWCHIYLDPIMLEPGFDLAKKIIGKGGRHTSTIFESTQTKVRLRGKGSGHSEHPTNREAPVPLMIALAAEHDDAEQFRHAFEQTTNLLSDVSKRFEGFVRSCGISSSSSRSAGVSRRFWIGEIPEKSRECLGDLAPSLL